MQTIVRHTSLSDIEAVMAIYDYARKRMHSAGNPTQWVGGYPSREVIAADIEARENHVIESGGNIIGVFSFCFGAEPSYSVIEGAWPDNEPYATIHRIAAAEGYCGIADAALRFCMEAGVNIRIDTHADNAPMLGWIRKQGFRYCGIIHVADGTPRLAFQKTTN